MCETAWFKALRFQYKSFHQNIPLWQDLLKWQGVSTRHWTKWETTWERSYSWILVFRGKKFPGDAITSSVEMVESSGFAYHPDVNRCSLTTNRLLSASGCSLVASIFYNAGKKVWQQWFQHLCWHGESGATVSYWALEACRIEFLTLEACRIEFE